MKYILSLILGVIQIQSTAQQFQNANYVKNESYLFFHNNDYVEFSLPMVSGLGKINYAGHGKYISSRKKNIISIKMFNGYLKGSESSYSIRKHIISDSLLTFCIKNSEGDAIRSAYVFFKNDNKEIIYLTDSNGKCNILLSKIPKKSIIEINILTYQGIRIKIDEIKGLTYDVILAEGSFGFADHFKNKKLNLYFNYMKDSVICGFYLKKDMNLIKLYKKKDD